jgi:hypothetical protein
MRATADTSSVSHHRSLRHPARPTYCVPVTRVRHSVAVPLHVALQAAEPAPDSEPDPPEWLTDAWKHRVEAEAMHRLEHRLHGAG